MVRAAEEPAMTANSAETSLSSSLASDDPPREVISALPPLVRIGCDFTFDVAADVHTVVIVEPHRSERPRVVRDEFVVAGNGPVRTYYDAFGNLCRRVTLRSGHAVLGYDALVSTGDFDRRSVDAHEAAPSDLPDDALAYLLPSRYCPSDVLAPEAARLFGSSTRGWSRVDEIVAWTHDHLTFAYGSSSPTKTAADAWRDGTGVCRDFAHLAITMCRALNIPARYVVGYLPDIAVPDPGAPMDFCAWAEMFVGDRWYTFDPRNHDQHRVGRVVIGRGRDAADVAMTTTFGSARLVSMTVVAEPATAMG
jgi:transglutaminase-like putative cysteine protease